MIRVAQETSLTPAVGLKRFHLGLSLSVLDSQTRVTSLVWASRCMRMLLPKGDKYGKSVITPTPPEIT